VFAHAAAAGAFVRIDMEDHTKTDRTLELWRDLRPVNADSGVVIQAALRRSRDDIDRLIAERARVRLCKGAYREPPSVAYQERGEIDRAYVALMERLLGEGEYPAIATHDERIQRRAVELARRDGIGPERFEFQMLYGVRRDLQERLAADGWTVRVYTPYGGEWFPYFMRRLAERPANVAFVIRSVVHEWRGRG
jgi:proline dehydrogenase